MIRRPGSAAAPLLYDTPHSGRHRPSDWDTKASLLELRRGEDAYVDQLLVRATLHGATILEATYPRCYIDLNRVQTDIDADLLAEPWPGPIAPTEKSARGLGLIRRFVVPGVEVNARRLSVRDVESRIATIYRPYHTALATLVDDLRHTHGTVWHVNWHSMKSIGNAMTPDGAGALRPDMVVSDRHGTSASPNVTAFMVDTLRSLGHTVTVNTPYAGGSIVQRTGKPDEGVHSVQIEINRALYLDESAVARTAGFAALEATLDEFTRRLAERCRQIEFI
jgi:N-formylglutamate deformylase